MLALLPLAGPVGLLLLPLFLLMGGLGGLGLLVSLANPTAGMSGNIYLGGSGPINLLGASIVFLMVAF